MRLSIVAMSWLLCSWGPAFAAGDADRWQALNNDLKQYREALDRFHQEHGGAYKLPSVRFFLFGMGGRDKFLYCKGQLRDAITGRVVRSWDVTEELIVPPDYAVALKTRDGGTVILSEDESAVWVEADGKKEALSKSDVKLPDFKDRKHRLILRVLHQELLVNVVKGKPVPNLFVYPKPWYRDAAMMAMAFQKTHNVHVLKEWILGLREPYDKNNDGETEADNLGQTLFLISLVSGKSHPLVGVVRKEFEQFKKENWIEGRSDFAAHPVYQTKWAKFGLKSLGLDDPYTVPRVKDSYAALFWWAYKKDDQPGQPITTDHRYPYLGWASNHYANKKDCKLSDRDYPLTWEAEASQAQYDGMKRIDPEYVKAKVCAPHTWHAAEAFLYLIEESD